MSVPRIYVIVVAALYLTTSPSNGILPFDEDLTVTTAFGEVEGIDLGESYGFLGIPFGRPPVGALRFTEPQPPAPWNHPLSAKIYPPGCIQICREPPDACPAETSEDCLYLNIWIPKSNSSTDDLHPVFMFIHGGNFRDGAGGVPLYDGRYLADYTDAIIVTINYRLEAFGWLYLGNVTDPDSGEEYPLVNLGLKDQRLAMKFLYENIRHFGGDPHRITISGQSAGAQSVGFHMISPKSDLYFQQGIMFSNPFSLPYKIPGDALKMADIFAEELGCQHRDLACFRSRSAKEILVASQETATNVINPREILQFFEQWNPTVGEGEFPEEILEALAMGQFQRKPVMLGTTIDEGVLFIYSIFSQEMNQLLYRTVMRVAARDFTRDALQQYPPGLQEDQRDLLSKVTTDYIFMCPTINVSKIFTESFGHSEVFHYLLDASWSFSEGWTDGFSMCYGRPCHGGDLPYIFRTAPLGGYSFTGEETEMINDMSSYLGNFFHNANPNVPKSAEMRQKQPKDIPFWPKFGEKAGSTYSLLYSLCGTSVYSNYGKDLCPLLDSFGYYKRSPLNF